MKDQSEQPDLQKLDQVKTDDQSEAQRPSLKMTCDDVKVSKEQQTGQLMKEVGPIVPSFSAKPKLETRKSEQKLILTGFYSVFQQLEQTQKELSRLQQLNNSLKVELQQERKSQLQVHR